MTKRLDTEKAAAILRDAGWDVQTVGNQVFGYSRESFDFIGAHAIRVFGSLDGDDFEAKALEERANSLLAMAAICRRIEAEAITEDAT